MIVMNVTYTMQPGMREKFLEEVTAQGILAGFRGEKGCLQYEYFAAVEDPDRLFLLERWEDEACLQAHAAGASMAKLQGVKARYVREAKLDRCVPAKTSETAPGAL